MIVLVGLRSEVKKKKWRNEMRDRYAPES